MLFRSDDTAKRNIVAVFPGTNLKIVGDKTTLNQIDRIAVVKFLPEPKGTQSCSYTARTVTMNLLEAESVIYDRRTGKELARRKFAPRRVCPEMVALEAKQTKIGSEMPRDQITAYLKTELAKK